MKNILFYLDESQYNSSYDSTRYAIDNFRAVSDFNVSVSFEPNADLAKDADVIFCRFEIPVKYDFLTELHEKYELVSDKLFLNSPISKRKFTSKEYLENFFDLDILPDTLISNNPKELAYFAKEQNYYISKPLDGNQGKGIQKLNSFGKSLSELEQIAFENTSNGSNKIIYQQCIPNVEKLGDKRINVLFYEPVNGVLRLPPSGSYICNCASGGSANKTDITRKDYKIVEKIIPFLKENGLLWCGVDVIGNYLTEINVSSPGLLDEADMLNSNRNGIDFLIDKIKKY
jgi:glutathione synthase